MTAKHVLRNRIRSIGRERSETLARLSVEAARDENGERARRYVELSRAVCAKARVRMPGGFRYCRRCNTPLVPGVNCTVRLRGGRIVSACPHCGAVRREPYRTGERE